MNPWLCKIRSETPYRASVFRITRVAREETRHRAVVTRIDQTRRMLRSSEAHSVGGVLVTETELNAAETIVADVEQRIAAELIEHPAERPRVREFRELAAEAAKAMADPDAAPLRPVNFDALGVWLAAGLPAALADSKPGSSPLFGALECEVTPPLGVMDE